MDLLDAPPEHLTALDEGRAFAELSWLRTISVSGTDAAGWLHDLLTADIASLLAGESRRSLLLTPTGRIRADVMVGRDEDGFLLLQTADQADDIGATLAPYVLSSDVTLADATDELTVLAVIGQAATDAPATVLEPSILGRGKDVVTPVPATSRMRESLARDLTEVGWDALEVWRIRRGVPRMGADFDAGSLPAEAGLDDAIDATKGCFLGQESVAKIRNMGHPPTVLRLVEGNVPFSPGSMVRTKQGEDVGIVTSAAAAPAGSGTVALVRVRWAGAEVALEIDTESELVPVRSLA